MKPVLMICDFWKLIYSKFSIKLFNFFSYEYVKHKYVYHLCLEIKQSKFSSCQTMWENESTRRWGNCWKKIKNLLHQLKIVAKFCSGVAYIISNIFFVFKHEFGFKYSFLFELITWIHITFSEQTICRFGTNGSRENKKT